MDKMISKLKYSARSKIDEDIAYKSLAVNNIGVDEHFVSGSGQPDDPYRVEITFQNNSTGCFEGVIHSELTVPKNDPGFFMPGFMYGRNRGEAPLYVLNQFPRIRNEKCEGDGHASPWWMVRSDRLSHPAAFIYDSGVVCGFHTSPYFDSIDQYGGFTCNLNAGEYLSSVGFTIGYENAPWHFIQSRLIYDRKELSDNCITLMPGEKISISLYIYEYKAENKTGIYDALKNVYYFYHESPRKIGSPKKALTDLAGAVNDYAYIKDEYSYSGFVREAGDGFSYNKIYSLSWTNGYSVAAPMLMASNKLGNECMRNNALECMENMLKNCMNPSSNLPYDAYDENGVWGTKGWWYDGLHTGGHSSYLSGQFVYYLLKAYENEKNTHNTEHNDWIDFVKPIIKRFNNEINSENEYPYIFSEYSGAGLEYDSLGSSWCMCATAYYEYLTHDDTYLDKLKACEMHYYRKFIEKVECYGAPHDTDKAVDNEGCLAYIRACMYMHMITDDNIYLDHLRDGLYYEYTFKFCMNVRIKHPPLSTIGWHSCGGSITSTANPHIHPMSSTIIREMKYYVEKTGDEYVKDRMNDTILWGCQTYNTYDNEYGYGKIGWMSERFCYSEGLLTEKYPDGTPASTWFALMPWASASIIEGLIECV